MAVRASAEAAVTGDAHYVLDGADADVLLVVADGPDGIALYEVDPAQPGVSRAAVTTLDETRRMATVRLTTPPAAASASAWTWLRSGTWPASRSAPSRSGPPARLST